MRYAQGAPRSVLLSAVPLGPPHLHLPAHAINAEGDGVGAAVLHPHPALPQLGARALSKAK